MKRKTQTYIFPLPVDGILKFSLLRGTRIVGVSFQFERVEIYTTHELGEEEMEERVLKFFSSGEIIIGFHQHRFIGMCQNNVELNEPLYVYELTK